MLNNVSIVGRLTKDVELRRTEDGVPYVLFTLAVNKINKDEADFIPCVAWRKTAEMMNQYLGKGSLIGIEGSVQTFVKTGPENNKTTMVNILTRNVTFLDSNKKENDPKQINNNADEVYPHDIDVNDIDY